jgi:4-amino-4-deoxy-L-arabinose transferase-like glycosyltransferase
MSGLDGSSSFTPNPHFFHYPSLVIYLQLATLGIVRAGLAVTGKAPGADAVRSLYAADPTVFYLAGRAVAAALGALTVVPVYRLARRAGGSSAALLAGLLVALSPALIARSQTIEVDGPVALLVTWALALAVDLAERPQPRQMGRAALCGVVVGLAASAKYPGFLALLPVLLAIAGRARRGRPSSPWSEALVAGVSACAAFALTSPFVLLDARAALRDLAAESAHLRLGHFGSEQGASWAYYARSWFADALGWLVGILALAGIARFALWGRRTWAVLSATLVLALFALVSAWAMKADRYLLPLVPAGIVFAAALGAEIAGKLARRPAAVGAVLALTAACLATDLPRWRQLTDRFHPDPRTVAAAWIQRSLPDGAMLVMEPYGPSVPSPLEGFAAGGGADSPQARRERGGKYFWVVPLPLFQVEPERTAVYYDPRLYQEADAWIVTGAARDRYRREPARFRTQNAFYEWLAASWREAAHFGSGGTAGSEIVIYRNPDRSEPFGSRVAPPPAPTPLMVRTGCVGGEAAYFYALGLNYLAFGRARYAAVCFQTALSLPTLSGGVTRDRLERARDLSTARMLAEPTPGP